jgi:hypothetical protein
MSVKDLLERPDIVPFPTEQSSLSIYKQGESREQLGSDSGGKARPRKSIRDYEDEVAALKTEIVRLN